SAWEKSSFRSFSRSGIHCLFASSFQLHNPDVAIEDGVAVILQMQGALAAGEFEVVMNLHAVVKDGDASRLFFALGIGRGALEFHVICLPGQRRITHVHARRLTAIKTSALVAPSFQPKAVEDLDFMFAMEVDTAVATPLAACRRLKGRAKF